MATRYQDIYALVKTEYQNTPLSDLLRKPTTGLLGVSTAAANAVKSFDVNTIFDLATSDVFENARKILEAGNNPKSFMYQHGNPSADLVRESVVGGTKIDQLRYLSIAALERVPEAAAPTIAAALDVSNIRDLAMYPPHKAAMRILNAAYFPDNSPGFDAEQPADLLPTNGDYPTERVQYTTLVMDDIKIGTTAATIDILADTFKPLDLTKLAGADAGFQNVAFGALLTLSQSWYAQGVTLGNLLHSVSLAPGESTRMAVIDWTRKSSAGQTDTIFEADDLANETSRNRAMNEVTRATASDAQSGFSSSRSSGSAQQVGAAAGAVATFALGTFGFGAAGAAATYSAASNKSAADSFSTSSGFRSLGASTLQNVNDRTHQNAHSVRSKRAAVVMEVSQTEHESISTRILANYNQMTKASLTKVDKVVFIPVKLMDFKNDDLIRRFGAALIAASPSPNIKQQLMNLDFAELSPNKSTNYTWLGGKSPETLPTLSKSMAYRTIETVASAVPGQSTPQTTSEEIPTKMPSPSERWLETAKKLWDTVQQTSRISGMLSQPVLRPYSTSFFVPTDVAVEGVTLQFSDDTEHTAWFETVTGQHISMTELNSGTFLSLTELESFKIGLQALEDRDCNVRTQLILNRNGSDFHWNCLSSLDATQIALLLSGYVVNVKQRQSNGQVIDKPVPVSQVVEPQPIRYIGNYLAFKMNPNEDDPDWKSWLDTRGLKVGAASEDLVPLPSGGTFAEAVLGRYNCAEKLDMTRFWNWQDSPIPLLPSDIAAIQSGNHDTSDDVKPGQLGAPIINISAPTALPEPTGLAAILAAVQNGNMFRDMSGSQGTFQLAQGATTAATAGAISAGQLASQNLANQWQALTEQQRIAAQKDLGMAQLMTGGSANPSKGGQNISQDGAKVNYFDKTQDEGYTEYPAALASVWGDEMSRLALLRKVAGNGSGTFGHNEAAAAGYMKIMAERAQKEAQDWADLISFSPPVDIYKDLKTRNMELQPLEKAYGNTVNLDKSSVEILKLPTVNGEASHRRRTVEHYLNSYVDNSLANFRPYTPTDGTLWASENPLRTVFKIDVFPNNAAVVCSEANATRWRFSTIHTEDTWDHPISGTREFGLQKSTTGNPVICTRGVDRPTSLHVAAGAFFAYSQQAKLWQSFLTKVADFVNKNGGQAHVVPHVQKFLLWNELIGTSTPLISL
ncbi:MAG: hypothetical protein Q9208_003282 [Pyrenodesmia sp. 3 TL-2023]